MHRLPLRLTVALGLAAALASAAPPQDKPWQVSLGLGATKGLLSLGRDFGPHYLGAGLHGFAYSQRDGFICQPALGYQLRFPNRYLPYLGVSADLTYHAQGGLWNAPTLLPALGYEFRFRYIYAQVEGMLGIPLEKDSNRKWGPALGAGIGLPF